jgi:hypothetical protein
MTKTNRGEPDRCRVSGNETYEVSHFADKHVSPPQKPAISYARATIARPLIARRRS